MLTKLEASAKLYLLVFVMFLFAILLGFYGLSGMRTMNQNTRTLYEDRVVPLQQLTTIRYSYLNGIISSAEHAHAANITFSDAGKQVQETEKIISDNWKAYLLTYLTPEEDKLAKQVSVLMNQSVKTVEELKYVLKKEDPSPLDNLIKKELYPAVDPIILKLNELIELQIKIGGSLYRNSSEVYKWSLNKLLLLIILSLLFAVPFSYYLVRSIKRLIEDLKTSNDKIAQSEKKYRNIFENVQDVFYQTTLAGNILDVSPSCQALTGWSREELIGRSAASLYYFPEDRESGIAILKETGEVKEQEHFFKTKTGEQVNVSMNAHLISNADGSPSHIDGTLRNISKRKKAEEKLIQSEARLKEAQALAHIGNWEIDMVNNIHTWSDEIYNIYGVSKEEVQPSVEAMLSFMHPDDVKEAETGINMALATLTSATSNFRFIRKGGADRFAHIEWRFEFDKNKNPVRLYGILQDITERKRAQESIKQYEQKLTKAAIKAQEDERYEIGGELHDNVCQILAGSLIYLGMLKEPLPPGSREYFDKTHDFITLATNEIRNLSHRLAPALFDDATLEYAFDNLLTDFNIEKKYAISLHFDNLSKTYPLSRDLQLSLYRILQEQVRNILKHAKATRIEVELAIINNVLQMRIKDNGIGFDAAANSGGIGLANMNRRVQLFSGTLTIHSTIGNGCEVLVKIPLATDGQ